MIFITSALFIMPLLANVMDANMPIRVEAKEFENRILEKTDISGREKLLDYYKRFFALFEGSILPGNWLSILFVIAAVLTGYVYSFGFFNLSRFAAHFWVPYTNVYLAVLPLIMIFFGREVTAYQIIGAVVTTVGLMIGVMDYSKNKVVEIEKKNFNK
jgi:hypothetical protein